VRFSTIEYDFGVGEDRVEQAGEVIRGFLSLTNLKYGSGPVRWDGFEEPIRQLSQGCDAMAFCTLLELGRRLEARGASEPNPNPNPNPNWRLEARGASEVVDSHCVSSYYEDAALLLEQVHENLDDLDLDLDLDTLLQVHENLGRVAILHSLTTKIEKVDKSEIERVRGLKGPWLSGRVEADGAQYPTTGGLRVGQDRPGKICRRRFGNGNRLRKIDEPENDGQVLSGLSRWMHALGQSSIRLEDPWAARRGHDLVKAVHGPFSYTNER